MSSNKSHQPSVARSRGALAVLLCNCRRPRKLARAVHSGVRKSIDTRRGWFSFLGRQIYFPPRSLVYNLFRWQGTFEPQVQAALASFARDDTYAIDVGANIGLMSVHMLEQRQSLCVLSVEASPTAYACLAKTRDAFVGNDRWTIVNTAAMDRAGEVTFHECVDGNDSLSGLLDTKRGARSRAVAVPAVTLDQLWNDLGRPATSVIKVDVEGAEMTVLRGAKNCLHEARPVIIVEWWPDNFRAYGCRAQDLLEFARDAGYRVFSICGMSEVVDVVQLRMLHCLDTEDFILLPKDFGHIAEHRVELDFAAASVQLCK